MIYIVIFPVTFVFMWCSFTLLFPETPDTVIHFTLNGARPDPFQRLGEKFTLQYRGPFTLPAGKQTLKVVAVSKYVTLL